MAIQRGSCGLSAADRQQVYARAGMNAACIQHVERMIEGSGARTVGKGALVNVYVCLQSIKNGARRIVESHTCELIYAYELELDPSILAYYVQVPCQQIRRTTSSGRNHVSSANLDFLVFRRDRIELVECKKLGWLLRESNKVDTHWRKAGETWVHAPYSDWASGVGLKFHTWVAPDPPGVYLQNLEACYALFGVQLSPAEQAAVDQANRVLDRRPASIDELTSAIPGYSPRLALWMLASKQAYGPLISTPVDFFARFNLYTCEVQAREVDATTLRANSGSFAEVSVSDPLLNASSTDRKRAITAYAELQAAQAGRSPFTKRLRKLEKRVADAVSAGLSPLAGCLTRYSLSGNRSSRLLVEQEQAIEAALLAWNRGKVQLVKHLDYVFEDECRKRGVEPIGKARLDARRIAENPRRHALATGGLRAYHKVRASTDPRYRSLPPVGYGQLLCVDSSPFDLRFAADPIDGITPPKATFYVGIDGCCLLPMAHALIFGPARTDGLAILIREYVKRHGFLPQMIHLDRGSENRSIWLAEFCEGRISLRYSPSAGSAWNGIVENGIKRVNALVAHDLPGSTLPDQYGRSVDGRFKSINQARMAFTTVHELFVRYLYEDLPRTPSNDGRTPLEARDDALHSFGVMGASCEWNDDFLIQTSVRSRRWSYDKQKGVRVDSSWFVSERLCAALRKNCPEEVRPDCCDPSICHISIGGGWIRAFHSRVQRIACMSEQERLFELLWRPIARTDARGQRKSIDRARFDRHQLASAARPATQHLAPSSETTEMAEPTDTDAPRIDVDFDSLEPYDEREDY